MTPTYISLLPAKNDPVAGLCTMENPHVSLIFFGGSDDFDAGDIYGLQHIIDIVAPLIEPFTMEVTKAARFGRKEALELHSCEAQVIRDALMKVGHVKEMATTTLQRANYVPHISLHDWKVTPRNESAVGQKMLIDGIRLASGTYDERWQLTRFAER